MNKETWFNNRSQIPHFVNFSLEFAVYKIQMKLSICNHRAPVEHFLNFLTTIQTICGLLLEWPSPTKNPIYSLDFSLVFHLNRPPVFKFLPTAALFSYQWFRSTVKVSVFSSNRSIFSRIIENLRQVRKDWRCLRIGGKYISNPKTDQIVIKYFKRDLKLSTS